MPLCLQSVSPVEPQPVNGTPCISRNETMFWSKARLFLNWSARLKITSGSKLWSFLLQQIEVVEDREVLGRVAEFAQRGEDVGLGLPILGLQLRAQILVDASWARWRRTGRGL